MGLVGIWSIPADQQTVEIDEDGNPIGDPPEVCVSGYQDEDTGEGYGSWEAACRNQPGHVEPEPEGGVLEATPGVVQPEVADETIDRDF